MSQNKVLFTSGSTVISLGPDTSPHFPLNLLRSGPASSPQSQSLSNPTASLYFTYCQSQENSNTPETDWWWYKKIIRIILAIQICNDLFNWKSLRRCNSKQNIQSVCKIFVIDKCPRPANIVISHPDLSSLPLIEWSRRSSYRGEENIPVMLLPRRLGRILKSLRRCRSRRGFLSSPVTILIESVS